MRRENGDGAIINASEKATLGEVATISFSSRSSNNNNNVAHANHTSRKQVNRMREAFAYSTLANWFELARDAHDAQPID